MGKRNPGALKEYKVNVSVIGSASRTVLAASKEEAERTVEKMLLQPDRHSPFLHLRRFGRILFI